MTWCILVPVHTNNAVKWNITAVVLPVVRTLIQGSLWALGLGMGGLLVILLLLLLMKVILLNETWMCGRQYLSSRQDQSIVLPMSWGAGTIGKAKEAIAMGVLPVSVSVSLAKQVCQSCQTHHVVHIRLVRSKGSDGDDFTCQESSEEATTSLCGNCCLIYNDLANDLLVGWKCLVDQFFVPRDHLINFNLSPSHRCKSDSLYWTDFDSEEVEGLVE
jgi:hypothetical protein